MRTLLVAMLLAAVALTATSASIAPASAQPEQGARDGQVPLAGRYRYTAAAVLEAVARGEGRQTLDAYQRIAADAEAHGDRLTAIRAHYAAAYTAHRLTLFQPAIEHGTQALALAAQPPPSAELTRAALSVYVPLAYAYRSVGNAAQARRLLDEGLATARTAAAPEGAEAAMLRALSRVAASQGDRAAALAYAREAVQAQEAVLAGEVPMSRRGRTAARRHAANASLVLARLLIAEHRPDEADAALAKATGYARHVGIADLDAEIFLVAGQLALDRQDDTRAVALLEQGRADAERGRVARVLGEINRGLTHGYERLGKLDEAFAAARRATALVEGVRGELQDPGLRASLLDQRQSVYQSAVRLALRLDRTDEAFELAERSRARAFLDLLGNQAVLGKARTRGLAEEERRLRTRLADAAALGAEDDTEAVPAPSEAAAREYRAFLERVRRASGEAAALMSVEPVTLAEIQRLLPPGTTLLEYLVGEHDVVVWIVERASVQVRRISVARAALVTEVRELRAAIAEQAPIAEVERRAQALHERLLGPARPAIGGARLVIVPHDVLHYLPFAALRSPAGRWLADDFALSTVPSASVLKFLGDKGAAAPDRIAAFGNPDLGPALALRYAEREARAVAERFPATTTVLTRTDATEARAKRLGGEVGLLHFAVHGELSEQDPMGSALLLVPGDGEDGRLQVRELFGMDIAARLVVLSACETGLGKLSRGDELVGLQRAFLYAGTPAVVTTLWKVDDRASYLLMRGFYEHLATEGPAQALRAAQRALMVDFPHPFAWAAFGLTGAVR